MVKNSTNLHRFCHGPSLRFPCTYTSVPRSFTAFPRIFTNSQPSVVAAFGRQGCRAGNLTAGGLEITLRVLHSVMGSSTKLHLKVIFPRTYTTHAMPIFPRNYTGEPPNFHGPTPHHE